jgi:hypothetical protein
MARHFFVIPCQPRLKWCLTLFTLFTPLFTPRDLPHI